MCHRTCFTPGFSRSTVIATKKYKGMMEIGKVITGEYFLCDFICLCWSFCLYDSDTIENSMYMSIDCEVGSILRHREKNFCCFDTNSCKMSQLLKACRRDGVVLFHEYLTGFEYVFRLGSIESYRLDMAFYFGNSEFESILWTS